MKFKLTGLSLAVFAAAVLLAFISPPAALGQEGEAQVVDQVVVQVNNDVITLSRIRRELKEAVNARKQQGATEQQATEELAKRQPELIASLINEQLLLQKGKELDLTADVEAEVNRRILDEGKRQGITSVGALEEAMRQAGLDPADIRTTLRAEIMKSFVIQREVDAKIFYSLSQDELKKYYETHRDKFRRPESVILSEIYLSLAGKPEAEVKARALNLIAQARGGTDFGALAAANSEREDRGVRIAPENKGKVGAFEVPSLRADLAAAIQNTKAGGVTEPIRTDEGYQILRVDERTPGSDAVYNENRVREVITMERSEKERGMYLQTLRNEAYIKIADEYRDAVEPLLKINTKPAAAATTTTKKSDNKKP